MNKNTVAVLFGGVSSEHEVSRLTAASILENIDRQRWNPLVVGITYEFNRYVGGHDNPVTNFLARPGLWMQNFTTFEPDDSMIEVGIKALELVLPEEKGADVW